MTQSYTKLKGVQGRFKDCADSVDALKVEKADGKIAIELNEFPFRLTRSFSDKTILVPLTSSLYVPGKISNVSKVIVDVGTGYYVEKVSIGVNIILVK